jgi:hypothetical protein
MCMTDVYRVYKAPQEAPKKPKLNDLIKEDTPDVEFVCASARLRDAVENLEK